MTHESLLAKVAELERKVALLESRAPASSLKRFALQAGAVVGLLVVLGNLPLWAQKDDRPPSPQEFVCKGLTVLDKDGKPRLIIGQENSGAFLKIVSAEGKPEVVLSSVADGGLVGVFGRTDHLAGILVARKVGGDLTLMDYQTKAYASLGIDSNHDGFLKLQSHRDNVVVYAGADADGGFVRAFGHDGKKRAFLGVGPNMGDGLIMLFGADGTRRPLGGSSGDGQGVATASPELTDRDAKDKVRTDSFCKIYPVEMRAGVTYVIDLASKDFDPYLRLEDSSGNPLASDDDGGGGLNARITFTPTESGTYRVVATSFSRGTGRFVLTVRPK